MNRGDIMIDTSNSKLKSEEKCCKKCGRIFMYYGLGHMYCPICAELDNKTFKKIKEYLYNEGPTTLGEVADVTGVSVNQINQYLREGRLEIPEYSDVFIRCDSCGVEMRSGRFCPECANRLSHNLKAAFIANDEVGELRKKPSSGGKMRFLSGDGK